MTNNVRKIEYAREQKLIEASRAGDSDSFEYLFQQYLPIVMRVKAKYFLRGYDRDDWLQEGRITFFNTIANFDGRRHITLGKFFQTNFQNRIYSLIRREMAFKRRSNLLCSSLDAMQNESSEYERLFVTKHGGPHELAVLKEDCRNYCADLSKFESQVSGLFFAGKTSAQIAKILNCEESQVLNAINRCRNKFTRRVFQ